MAPQFVFQVQDASRLHNDKPVLQDISLSFDYRASISIVRGNGTGKSPLLRIMAGQDTRILGTSQLWKA